MLDIELIMGIVTLLFWGIQLGLVLFILKGQKKIKRMIVLMEDKKATPKRWASFLNDYFIGKEDEEGMMLSNAISKRLTKPKKSVNT